MSVSDASYGNLQGGGSQGGYVVSLVDSSDRKCLLSWQSRKVKRVVTSTLAAETLALLDSAEREIYLANLVTELMNLRNCSIVKCFVENKSLVDSLYFAKSVQDKHLRINLAMLADLLPRRNYIVFYGFS